MALPGSRMVALLLRLRPILPRTGRMYLRDDRELVALHLRLRYMVLRAAGNVMLLWSFYLVDWFRQDRVFERWVTIWRHDVVSARRLEFLRRALIAVAIVCLLIQLTSARFCFLVFSIITLLRFQNQLLHLHFIPDVHRGSHVTWIIWIRVSYSLLLTIYVGYWVIIISLKKWFREQRRHHRLFYFLATI